MIIKVCGMRDARNIAAVEQMAVDWMGFIFYPKSSRYVQEVPDYLPKKQKRIGVFVDVDEEEIAQKVRDFSLDGIQLHGQETPSCCMQLKRMFPDKIIIKAFGIRERNDFANVSVFDGICHYFLFDTKTEKKGGAGFSFDWSLLDAYRGETPFLLSGGIGDDDCERILQIKHPQLAGIDLNSKFEISPALKDVAKLNMFIQKIRNHE